MYGVGEIPIHFNALCNLVAAAASSSSGTTAVSYIYFVQSILFRFFMLSSFLHSIRSRFQTECSKTIQLIYLLYMCVRISSGSHKFISDCSWKIINSKFLYKNPRNYDIVLTSGGMRSNTWNKKHNVYIFVYNITNSALIFAHIF